MADDAWTLGREVDHGYDPDGCRRKEACLGVCDCPVCGRELFLVADTECRTEGEGGRWEHDGYGPAEAVCCGLLVVDSWDGCSVYRLAEGRPFHAILGRWRTDALARLAAEPDEEGRARVRAWLYR